MDGSLTDQTSVLRFTEDNWLGGTRIGHGSFDTLAGSLNRLFDWTVPQFTPLILNPDTDEPGADRPSRAPVSGDPVRRWVRRSVA